jgi:hypothetical protein
VGPRRASLPHIPTDGLLVGRTSDRARGPLFIFRKIHLYGKTKKSTHGHQTAKPFRTHFPERRETSTEPTLHHGTYPIAYSGLPYTHFATYPILSTYPILPTLYRVLRTDEADGNTTKSDRPTLYRLPCTAPREPTRIRPSQTGLPYTTYPISHPANRRSARGCAQVKPTYPIPLAYPIPPALHCTPRTDEAPEDAPKSDRATLYETRREA